MPAPADVKPRLKSAVPEFSVPDVVQTAEYYRDVLGFDIAGYWATPPCKPLLLTNAGVVGSGRRAAAFY